MENSNLHQNPLISLLKILVIPFVIIASPILNQLHLIEQFFIKLHNIYAFISQILFFTLCAIILNEFSNTITAHDKFAVMALKTILFYSVFTYFVAKSRDIYWHSNQRAPTWNFYESLCRIALEWAKAIVVILCLRDQGIHFRPSVCYAIITTTYYICTERIYVDILKNLVQLFDFEVMDGLEHLYVPIILNSYCIVIGLLADIYFFITEETKVYALVCLYFLVYVRTKDVYFNYWSVLNLEIETFNSFRNATNIELDNFDDVCAVCLNTMSKAKITPCNHYFHPNCLKQCLKTSFFCPICKTHFGK